MSTKGSASNLVQAVKELTVEWHMTKDHWRDVKSMEFEKNYVGPLPDYMIRALGVMEELDVILRKVRKDCE
jgi:hypothetical protein